MCNFITLTKKIIYLLEPSRSVLDCFTFLPPYVKKKQYVNSLILYQYKFYLYERPYFVYVLIDIL
jgi:hypothetical protein